MSKARENFLEYVESFYGKDGVYPMGATKEHIADATNTLLERHGTDENVSGSVAFDSWDRERVRDIMIAKFGLVFPASDNSLPPEEAAFVKKESDKHAAKLKRALRKVAKTGWAGRETINTLLISGLVIFGGPSEVSKYNHYRLTAKGKAALAS